MKKIIYIIQFMICASVTGAMAQVTITCDLAAQLLSKPVIATANNNLLVSNPVSSAIYQWQVNI